MAVQKIYEQFSDLLNRLQREEAITLGLQALEDKQLTIADLYESVITRALNAIEIPRDLESQLIWREHAMSGICRMLIELARPYVLREQKDGSNPLQGKKVLILSPEEEYHELGPRMGMDYFTIAGAQVDFVGVNLPLSNIRSAVSTLAPDIVCISVSNPLNLMNLDMYIEQIQDASPRPVHIALSGSAIGHIENKLHDLKADSLIRTFHDVMALGGERV